MRWVTREKVKVDRVACPWLIKKFIDPGAEFVFLPAHADWAGVRDGIVYDVPNCELGHHGEDVSFDSIVKKHGLADPALLLLAKIVRAAVSVQRSESGSRPGYCPTAPGGESTTVF